MYFKATYNEKIMLKKFDPFIFTKLKKNLSLNFLHNYQQKFV